ncbi:intercellular adhesion molecule 5 isoform X2 [Bombina bombina]|uniref:intercellular adhesion molecule 5 isoform X2 n=1 Tax=Bombina bombina TaxID=8345 RepID=UPI00235AFEE2|nr:intercellular adhesion molecule 5 isoform X2 [Bombina bombina]
MASYLNWNYHLTVLLILVTCLTGLEALQEDCTLKKESDTVYVRYNHTAVLNCTSCNKVSWESRLSKINTSEGQNLFSVEVLVNDWEISNISCLEVDNPANVKQIQVIAYAEPDLVTIDLQKEMEVGTTYNITCNVNNVAPVQDLMVKWTREGEEINTKSFKQETKRGITNVSVTHEIVAQRSDNLQNFSCSALLNVDKTRITSSSATIRTYDLSAEPQILIKKWIQKGDTVPATCKITDTFPAENVKIQILFNNADVLVRTEQEANGTVLGHANLDMNHSGIYDVTCLASLQGLSKKTNETVNVYEPFEVYLNVSKPTTLLNDSVLVECELIKGNAELYNIEIRVNGQKKCKVGDRPFVVCNVTADRRVPMETIECEAHLKGDPDIKSVAKKNVIVHYSPEFREDLCNNFITLTEGKGAIPCKADGNPLPNVTCYFGNWSVMAGTLIEVTRNLSGTFRCEASNKLGTAEKSPTLSVQYPPDKPSLEINPSTNIKKGDTVNLTCHADAYPKASYTWDFPTADIIYSADQSTIVISKATSSNDGTYICRASNTLGTRQEQRSILVTGGTLCWTLVGVGTALGIFLITSLAVYYYIKIRYKKRSYDLLKPNKKSNEEIPMNPL